MFAYSRKARYPTDKQVQIWNLKRENFTGKEIAKKLNADPGFVSRSLKEANTRIKGLLENVARMNKIKLDLLNEELGVARGHSHMFNIKTYITFSPTNGINICMTMKGTA